MNIQRIAELSTLTGDLTGYSNGLFVFALSGESCTLDFVVGAIYNVLLMALLLRCYQLQFATLCRIAEPFSAREGKLDTRNGRREVQPCL